MPLIQYEHSKLAPKTLAVIEQANAIIDEYVGQGYDLTLRQLYYQFVARGLLDNVEKNYKRLGEIVNSGRLAGLIDWDHIEDRTRFLRALSTWDSPADIVEGAARQFRLDAWADQESRVEVWIEKDALIGVIERACEELRVDFFSCRGYTSQSAMWRAAMRLAAYAKAGQQPVILHLGDHDPSGLDMSRDIVDRLDLFLRPRVSIRFKRLALNMDQVDEHKPVPNPAKTTDARFETYAARFGYESWELDALEPALLEQLVRSAIEEEIDMTLWDQSLEMERGGREQIEDAAATMG